jgi:hypothetical protein
MVALTNAALANTHSRNSPQIIQRRRIELADSRIPGSIQPFHAAKTMDLKNAEAFIASRAAESEAMATAAVRDAVAALVAKGFRVTGACVLTGSGRSGANLAATLASHPLIHTAEGDFFRNALRQACKACGLEVSAIREKDLLQQAAKASRLTVDDLKRWVSETGKTIGPPWRQDEKFCAIAAWTVLL